MKLTKEVFVGDFFIPAECPNPIFIVGVPRSGTTLLSRVLGRHSRIAIAPETHFFDYWLKRFPQLRSGNAAGLAEFWRSFRSHRIFKRLSLAPSIADVIEQDPASAAPSHLLAGLLSAHARKLGKARWGEKTPAHERHVSEILEFFPAARIVHIIRDPRAITASLRHVPWVTHREPATHGIRWRRAMERLEEWRGDTRVIVVRYEELVAQPKAAVSALCKALEEEFEEPMIVDSSTGDVQATPPKGVTVSEWARMHLTRASGPVATDGIARWKETLNKRDVSHIEHGAGQQLVKCGYEPSEPALRGLKLLAYHTSLAVSRLSRFRRRPPTQRPI